MSVYQVTGYVSGKTQVFPEVDLNCGNQADTLIEKPIEFSAEWAQPDELTADIIRCGVSDTAGYRQPQIQLIGLGNHPL